MNGLTLSPPDAAAPHRALEPAFAGRHALTPAAAAPGVAPRSPRSSALGPRPSSRGEGMVCPRSAAATLPFIRRLFQNGPSDGTYIASIDRIVSSVRMYTYR